jgi:hypothetical protein
MVMETLAFKYELLPSGTHPDKLKEYCDINHGMNGAYAVCSDVNLRLLSVIRDPESCKIITA